MSEIRNIGDGWPWPTVSEDRHAGGAAWFESNREHYWYGLNVLPPIYFPGGFFVSEPCCHDERDVPSYAAWVQIGEEGSARYFVREIPKDGWAKALAELREALRSPKVQP